VAISREQLIFDVFANTARAEGGFTNLGRKAAAASDDVMGLAKRLDEISAKSATARVKLAGNTEALAQLDRLDLKMASVGNRVMDPKVSIEGVARASVELTGLSAEIDRLGRKSAAAAGPAGVGALAGTGGLQGGGMGALIAAGVALSPVIVTLGFGLAGFAAAAYGAAAPVLKASSATGGLQANLSKLTPAQQQAGRSLLGLQRDYAAFSKSLQPQVLSVFNTGLRLAGNLMGDVAPVAKATGIALNSMLAAVDREFRSQTWQQFFGFMAKNAGPDIKLLSDTFVALLNTLPPLLEALQPIATALLVITRDGAQAVDVFSHFPQVVTASTLGLGELTAKAGPAGQSLDLFSQSTSRAIQHASAGNPIMVTFGKAMGFLGTLSAGAKLWLGLATGNIKASGQAAVAAAPKVWSLNKSVAALNTDMTTLVGNLLTLQGSDLAWKQSLQAAQAQLKSNSAGLEGNSKNALANRQAVLQSTQAAISFASEQLTLGKNIGEASRTVQAQIRWLQGLHDKSVFVRQELAALRREEQLLEQQKLAQKISVIAKGTWTVSGSQHFGQRGQTPTAKGWLVSGGIPGKDSVPILAMPGEAIVPRHLTPAVAPFLKAHGVPGFAQGGLIPSYSGSPGGMAGWIKHDDAATIRLIDLAVVKATLAGIKAAQAAAASAGGGPGGGFGASALVAQAYARSLFPFYGWPASQWPPLLALWNRESGWNASARNPSSGAAGIPQDITGNFHGGYQGQVRWGESYIRGRYGEPSTAWAHELALGWYDQGGWLHPGVTMAVNTTGRSEKVLPPGRSGSAGPLVHIENFNSYDATDPVLLGQRLSFAVVTASLGS
jgi:hypothetical protein